MKTSYVYLLHFHRPIAPGKHTCQHYMGSAEDVIERLLQHRAGQGARLCKVAIERGIVEAVGHGIDANPSQAPHGLRQFRDGRITNRATLNGVSVRGAQLQSGG